MRLSKIQQIKKTLDLSRKLTFNSIHHPRLRDVVKQPIAERSITREDNVVRVREEGWRNEGRTKRPAGDAERRC